MNFLIDLENFLRSRFPNYPAENVLALEPCPAGQEGDFTLNCFKIARFCGNPAAAAQAAAEFLGSHSAVKKVSAVKAFVNITLNAAELYNASAADMATLLDNVKLPEANRKRVLIEFSAPNTNKPQHLGHVRTRK